MEGEKMPLYYVEKESGCGIRQAKTKAQVLRELKKEIGNNVKLLRLATKIDIAWVKGMGGYIPELNDMNDKGWHKVKI
jgi:hypothetical protein